MTRLGPRDRGPARIVLAIALLVATAIAKPWSWGAEGAASGAPPANRPVAAVAGDPSATPAARALTCRDRPVWRVVAYVAGEQAGGYRVDIVPATRAAGPLDDDLPVVRMPTGVTDLGYCAPQRGPERPPSGARLTVWLMLDAEHAGGDPAALELVRISLPTDARSGALYSPASIGLWVPASSVQARWPINRYVFALRAGRWQRWWSVRVSDAVPDPRVIPMRPPIPSPRMGSWTSDSQARAR
jgi:hypothetical protein